MSCLVVISDLTALLISLRGACVDYWSTVNLVECWIGFKLAGDGSSLSDRLSLRIFFIWESQNMLEN